MINEVRLTISQYIDMADEMFIKTGQNYLEDAYKQEKCCHKITPDRGVNWLFLNTTSFKEL